MEHGGVGRTASRLPRVLTHRPPDRRALRSWSGERTKPCGRFASDQRALMPIEPNEAERTGEFRMVFLQLVEDAKRLRRIGDFREYASLAVIYEKEALHSFPLTPKAAFLTRKMRY